MNPHMIPMTWLVLGFFGQTMFSCRFIFQWIVSERRRESVVPEIFWWFSVAGGIMLLTYALYRKDPVFILGQIGGLAVYVRNLVLIYRRRYVAEGGV